ncbi:hypothetical protein NFI96_030147 [Prochilodus magdalenae]|nr:hypothetical protein NFI96_030147 [Prochilodus magdalenae]
MLNSSAAEEVCDSLTTVLGTNPLLLKELDLSGKIQGDLQMKKICGLLVDSHCRTQKLKLTKCSVTEADCASLSSALCLNPSHLTELDLSDNNLGNSGVKQICSLLKDQSCKLQSLGLSFCSITEGGLAALTSALKSNSSSQLIKLDLRGNDPGDTEMGELVKLFGTSHKKLRLLNSKDAEEAYNCLHKLLQEDPLLLKGLDLSKNKPNSIQVKQLSALLEDPHFRLEKLTLYKSGSITGRDSADLISALTVNPSHLRELDLNQNKLDHSGVQKLCDLLQNPHCKLEKLKLVKTFTDRSYFGLGTALCTNPSYIRELDLSKNKLGDTEVKELCILLKNENCKLQTLLLNNCSIGEEGCADLTSALTSNPSHLRELDLRKNKLGDSVKDLSDLLQKSGCTLLVDPSFRKWIRSWIESKTSQESEQKNKAANAEIQHRFDDHPHLQSSVD